MLESLNHGQGIVRQARKAAGARDRSKTGTAGQLVGHQDKGICIESIVFVVCSIAQRKSKKLIAKTINNKPNPQYFRCLVRVLFDILNDSRKAVRGLCHGH